MSRIGSPGSRLLRRDVDERDVDSGGRKASEAVLHGRQSEAAKAVSQSGVAATRTASMRAPAVALIMTRSDLLFRMALRPALTLPRPPERRLEQNTLAPRAESG